jgi:hypothetical protein
LQIFSKRIFLLNKKIFKGFIPFKKNGNWFWNLIGRGFIITKEDCQKLRILNDVGS